MHSYGLQTVDLCGLKQRRDTSHVGSCLIGSGPSGSPLKRRQLACKPPTLGCMGTCTAPARPAPSSYWRHWAGDSQSWVKSRKWCIFIPIYGDQWGLIAEPRCEAFESTEDAVTWGSGPGLLCQGCFESAAAPQPEGPGGDSWNKHNTQEVNLYFCALSPRLTEHANISQKMFFFSLWVLPAADRSRWLRLPRQTPAVRPRPLVVVPRHAQAPLDREGVADLFTRAVVFGRFLEIGVEQGHVSDSRS